VKLTVLWRLRTAAELANHLSLSLISPSDLSTIVSSSGLVTDRQLLDAYKEQALSLAKQSSIYYKKQRFSDVRKSCEDVVFDCASEAEIVEVVDCPALSSGIHQWSHSCRRIQFGVVSPVVRLQPTFGLCFQSIVRTL
jgi:hypothetical protein